MRDHSCVRIARCGRRSKALYSRVGEEQPAVARGQVLRDDRVGGRLVGALRRRQRVLRLRDQRVAAADALLAGEHRDHVAVEVPARLRAEAVHGLAGRERRTGRPPAAGPAQPDGQAQPARARRRQRDACRTPRRPRAPDSPPRSVSRARGGVAAVTVWRRQQSVKLARMR